MRVITQHVHRVVLRILEANYYITLRGDRRVPPPSWESVEVDPRTLFRICGIRFLLGVALRMALEKKEWNLFLMNDKVVNATARQVCP